MKKVGYGIGMWNGFGGKIEQEETIEQAAVRELAEEAGIRDGVLEIIGVLDFYFQNDEKISEDHFFKLTEFKQEPIETEEMKPQWFSFSEIPFAQMLPGDRYWFPLFLQGKSFKGAFLFDRPDDAEHSAKIIEQRLEEVS